LQNNDFRIDLKDPPTNHNVRYFTKLASVFAHKGGIAFLLTISKNGIPSLHLET